MDQLLESTSIRSLISVAGLAGAERLLVRFRERLAVSLDRLPTMSTEQARLEVHSLRGSASLLGMIALAEILRTVEDGADWHACEPAVREVSAASIAALGQLLEKAC